MLVTNVNAVKETKVINAKIAKVKIAKIKKEVVKKDAVIKEEKKEKKSLVKINLSQFADKLKSITIKEKVKKDAKYIYPESFSANDINESKGKKFRASLRTKLNRISNNIFYFTQTKEENKLINEVKEFTVFYKENYLVNDYTLVSLTNSVDESKKKDFSLLLEIAKVVNKIK